MIETALIAAVTAAAAYGVARWRASSDDEGCNGHHWNDMEPVTEVSLRDRHNAGYGDSIVRGTDRGRRTVIIGDEVYLKRKAVKRCDDCGACDSDVIYVGSVPIEEFEESEGGV